MKFFNIIDRYLKGKMSANELEAFEKKMDADEDLRMEVETQRFEEELIDYAVKQRIHKELEELQAQESPESIGKRKASRTNRRRYIVIAIAATILLLLLPLIFPASSKLDLRQTAKLQAEANPALSYFEFNSSRGEEGNFFNEKPFDRFRLQINAGEEQQIQGIIAELLQLEEDLNDPSVTYFLAAAYYNLADYEQAATQFGKVGNAGASTEILKEWAEYHQLLSLVQAKTGPNELLSFIQQIQNRDSIHSFSSEIAVLEDQLKAME